MSAARILDFSRTHIVTEVVCIEVPMMLCNDFPSFKYSKEVLAHEHLIQNLQAVQTAIISPIQFQNGSGREELLVRNYKFLSSHH